MKITNLSLKAKKLEDITLPKDFDGKVNLNLLAQAVHVYRERQHIGLVTVKTRGEVDLTTRKMYKQKGTGNARHGSASAPIFVGGGKAHGPRPERRILTLPSKFKKQALYSAMSLKIKEGEAYLVSDLAKVSKIKDAATFMKDFIAENKLKNSNTKFTFVMNSMKNNKAFRNLGNAKTVLYSNLNAYDVLMAKFLILDATIFERPTPKTTTKKLK